MKCFAATAIVLLNLVVNSYTFRNEAVFFTNTWEWSMNESAPIGSRPHISNTNEEVKLTASVTDSVIFSVQGEIGTKYFTVDGDRDGNGIVKLRKQFDREVDSEYFVKFAVRNGEYKEEKEAHIRIIDANDNPPIFEKIRYEFRIPENAPRGTEVGRIRAHDPDEREGGEVRYTLEEEGDPNPFEIIFTSGRILILQENIDYEELTTYRLLAVARDQDRNNPLSSSVTIVIHVDDIQDTDPIFENLPYNRTIDENTDVGAEVVSIQAVDGDRGIPNDIAYSLIAGDDVGNFLMTSNRVRVAKNIDRDRAGFNGVFRLTVRATELSTRGSSGGAYKEVSFEINIRDLNDEKPKFDKSNRCSYQLSLPESTPVGTLLPLGRVTDNDQGANSDVTMSVDWRKKDMVTVTPVTFRQSADISLVLIRPLDYESSRRLEFKIFANETNKPRTHTPCDIRINVENENDNAPVFEESNYQVNLSESTPVDSIILQAVAHDTDIGDFGRVLYSLENSRGEIKIRRRTGAIRLTKELDYEDSQTKQYLLSARDIAEYPQTARALLTINVLDENDNPPTFLPTMPSPTVKENVRAEGIATIQATDADTFPHDLITYSIGDGPYSEHFSIDSQSGVVNVVEPLDYESVQEGRIELDMVASDSVFTSTATLVVYVEDENDQSPEFIQIHDFNVTENIGGGILVGSVVARDFDSGRNGEVSYYVTSGQEKFVEVFQLNEETGEIRTKPGISPDYERFNLYDITVTSQDGGSPSRSTSRSLRITVNDVNDNPPKFEKPFYEVTLDENERLRGLRVRATDVDSGENAVVRYRITKGNIGRTFGVSEENGLIYDRRRLDFETLGGRVTLEVSAEDNGKEKLSSTTQVDIIINDVNDNPPTFRPGTQTMFQVLENIVSPTVASFNAYDRDTGGNAKVTYSIAKGNDEGRFSISPLDGEVRVAHGAELDRETQAYYNLTICANNTEASPPLHATLDIVVQVLDVNDNTPEFIDLASSLNVSENTALLSFYRLRAHDSDSGSYGEVVYSIDSPDGVFIVDAKSGVIDLVKPILDREKSDRYILTVTASDNPLDPANSRSTTKTITILVDDDNDERPQFLGSTPYQATIFEETSPGTALTFTGDTLRAEDKDDGLNAELTYTIRGEMASSFRIDHETGIIQNLVNLDRERLRSDVFEITVRATDGGGLYSDAVVRITIVDINDNHPLFDRRNLKFENKILESAQPGHAATQVVASDLDKGQNGQIHYRIASGGYDKFVINPETGVISLAPGQYLDREEMEKYKLRIIATDLAPTNPKSSQTYVRISVDDVNDSRPRFYENFRSTTVRENSAVGRRLTQLSATDDDLEPSLSFSMTTVSMYDALGRPLVVDSSVDDVMQTEYEDILSWFQLNATTGELTLQSSNPSAHSTVDRERSSLVVINFKVRDNACSNEELAESLQQITLRIDIEDQNDNSPEIEILTNDYTDMGDEGVIVDVTEECAKMTRLFAIAAHDPDFGKNGRVVFDLENLGVNMVTLTPDNPGVIFSSTRFDRESLARTGGSGWVNVTIVARDSGPSPSRFTSLPVHFRVNDINDNKPKFLSNSYKVSVSEDTAPGSFVKSVTATDSDDGDFGEVRYSLFGAMGFFDIHPRNGRILVAKALDRELYDRHIFTVIAKDNIRGAEENRFESTAQVTVFVTDVNDNIPVFTQPHPQPITVYEDTSPRTSVAMVKATDPDEGDNGRIVYSMTSFIDCFTVDRVRGDVTISRQILVSPRTPVVGNITIFATDGGGLESNVTLQVEIVDVNNHAPEFTAPKFNFIPILEEQPAGLFVTQVNATDRDIGSNGIVRYKMENQFENKFFVDERTGRVATLQKLDREKRSSYALAIEAHDLGNPPRYSYQRKTLTIQLIDVNDNRPTFARSGPQGATQTLSVAEDALVGKVIGNLKRATDPDENPRVHYHILEQDKSGRGKEIFRLEGRHILLNLPLDRESTDRYNLIIGATNNENFTRPFTEGRWDATVQLQPSGLQANRIYQPVSLTWSPANDPTLLSLTISVDDVIDEAPKFHRSEYVAAVLNDAQPDTFVIKMNATDNDVNDALKYSITKSKLIKSDETSSNADGTFVIKSRDGTVSTKSRISDQDGYYLLTILATDLANLNATTTLKIEVYRDSQRIQFIVYSPPDVVSEQRSKFREMLRNITGSIVSVVDIKGHVTSSKPRDVMTSDVTIQVFDTETSKDEIIRRLRDGKSHIQRLFKNYSFREKTDKENTSDPRMLRAGFVILLILLIIIIICFLIIFIHMRRTHKKEIEELKAALLDEIAPDGNIMPRRVANITDNSNNDKPEKPSNRDSGSEKSRSSYVQDQKAHAQHSVIRSCTATNAPTIADTLLWSPSAPRAATTRSVNAARLNSPSEDTRDTFENDIILHAPGCGGKSLTPLHGSDSNSSF
ncbi:unnamed protein product [Clavelina lepadiformis]|uniref:Cadherin domain-containing protein n=1 Tax=Clavelina lepadiformis TaxID=159417 RepID=A0ABP0EY62_CLALP